MIDGYVGVWHVHVLCVSGTGIVHQAPAFGEDDYRVCIAHGIVDKGKDGMPCPVDCDGCFSAEVSDFKGLHVKAADNPIAERLRVEGKVVAKAR